MCRSPKNDRFQPEIMRRAVDTQQVKKIIPLYQELLTDRTFELRLALAGKPEPGRKVNLVLDLGTLPRGPLNLKSLPEGAELYILRSGRELDDFYTRYGLTRGDADLATEKEVTGTNRLSAG